MPYCRSCHQKISKFDVDVCPHCGKAHPIDPNYETMDITKNMTALSGKYELPKTRKRSTMVLLCATLGIFGVHWFYARYPSRGIIAIIGNIILIAGIGSLLLLTELPPYADYLIGLGVMMIVALIEALLLALAEAPKDGKGDYLR